MLRFILLALAPWLARSTDGRYAHCTELALSDLGCVARAGHFMLTPTVRVSTCAASADHAPHASGMRRSQRSRLRWQISLNEYCCSTTSQPASSTATSSSLSRSLTAARAASTTSRGTAAVGSTAKPASRSASTASESGERAVGSAGAFIRLSASSAERAAARAASSSSNAEGAVEAIDVR